MKSTVKRYWKAIAAAAGLLGVLFGEVALKSAHDAKPPLTWEAIGFIAVFGVIGMIFVLGIQVISKNFKGAYWGWMFFALNAVYMTSTGVSAAAISLTRGEFGPASGLFIAFGGGTGIGLFFMKSSCLKNGR
ncbi:hypothetical protein ACES2I_08700 [Bdellovibrio bacteriovorus]|uniref:hypothetical protein n=1 Tax=Bdellovibrio bacteriovorus TaxID=959 RepID=UPI0035A5D4C8